MPITNTSGLLVEVEAGAARSVHMSADSSRLALGLETAENKGAVQLYDLRKGHSCNSTRLYHSILRVKDGG